MNHFDFKNAVKRNIILREGWQDVGDDRVDGMAGEYGLASDQNKESLMSLLDDVQDDIGLEDEQKVELVNLMRDLAQEHDVVLEQNLKGLQSEKDRVIPAKTILDFLNGLGLDTTKTRKLVKTLDQWAKYNSVRFDSRPTDVRPSDKTSLDNVDRKKTPPKPAMDKESFKTGQMQPGDEEVEIVPAGQEYADADLNADDEFERAETEEVPRPANDVDVCAGLLDSLKKADPKLFDSMQDDDTIRGAIANFANDLSFTADAVVVSALGAAAAIPPAAPVLGAIAAGGTTVGRAGAAVAVAMDLALLNGKDALIDSIGLIPWGKWIGKGLGKAGKAATKAGGKASSEATQKLLKTAGKAGQTAAESGIKNLEKTLAEKILKAAPKLGQEGAENAAKAIMTAVEQRIQTKLKSGGYGKGAPDPNKFKNPKEYKRALKSWQEARKEALEGEYKNCFRKDNLEIKNKALNLINAANDYVDDFPEAFDAVIGKGIDAVMWAKEFIFSDDDPMDAPPALAAQSSKKLNEQKYIMLLERFNIK
jgi:hypothetical protein